MNIQIGDYVIRSDAYCVSVHSQCRVMDPKSKRYGEIILKHVGYYPDLKMALKGVSDRLVMTSGADSVEKLLEAIESLENTIREVCGDATC